MQDTLRDEENANVLVVVVEAFREEESVVVTLCCGWGGLRDTKSVAET